MIIERRNLLEHLKECAQHRGQRGKLEIVYDGLKLGDWVYKSGKRIYEIDNLDLFSQAGYNGDAPVPYNSVRRWFNEEYNKWKTLQIIKNEGRAESNKRFVLPYSRMFEKRTGACTEKAILLELTVQQRLRGQVPSFLIDGWHALDGKDFAHHFNIIFDNGTPLLVDTEIAVYDPRGNLEPTAFPISEIRHGEIVSAAFPQHDLRYRLF